MRFTYIFALLVLLSALFVLPVFAQEDPSQDEEGLPPQPVCAAAASQNEPVSIQAPSIESSGSMIRANGGVAFERGNIRITAADAVYNYDTKTGLLTKVTFTTCASARPDYKITAREIRLLPNNKLRAQHASLFIGRLKVLSVPSLKLTVGGGAASSNIFPTPGYDKVDGFTLSQRLRVIDDDRARMSVNLRITSKSGVQGDVSGQYGLDGNLSSFPGRFLSYQSLRSHVLDFPREPVGAPCPPSELQPIDAAHLRAFGILSLKQPTYDISDENLIVYRQPELGLNYIANGINLTKTPLDPRLQIHPEITGDWGRFKESPGMSGFTTRRSVTGTVAANVIPLGSNMAIQPIYSHTWSTYDTGDFYQQSAYAIDASRLLSNGSFASLRYIGRHESGITPFQFDNIDIKQEAQAAFQARLRKHVFGVVLSYDIEAGSLYDWEAMYGWHSDCLASWVQWHSRVHRLSFHVALINL
ncbi:hypothetical protein LLG39_04990 [bacterium]|nr:hypothetical protein [bacterium]